MIFNLNMNKGLEISEEKSEPAHLDLGKAVGYHASSVLFVKERAGAERGAAPTGVKAVGAAKD